MLDKWLKCRIILLLTAYCLLLTAYCLLLTAYCLLLTVPVKVEVILPLPAYGSTLVASRLVLKCG